MNKLQMILAFKGNTLNGQNNPEKEKNSSLTLSDFKTLYKATVIKKKEWGIGI